jgi:hypothetical protein
VPTVLIEHIILFLGKNNTININMKQLNLLEFKNNVITVLGHLDLLSPFHVNLQLGTTAIESNFGQYRRQIGFENKKGGGYGINQIELATYHDLVNGFIKNKPDLKEKIHYWYDDSLGDEENLIINDNYNIVICRIKYYSTCEHIINEKDCNNVIELAKIWKKYYNTDMGKGTKEGFVDAYNKYILGYKIFE